MRLRCFLLVLLMVGFSFVISAQHDEKGCHVYVVEVEKALKMDEMSEAQLKECGKKPAMCGITEFPNFEPLMGEEELTTKTFKFPFAPLIITASVFVTDESGLGDETATLTITLAKNSPKGVQADENSAQAEISLGNKSQARVKRYYRVNKKEYLVGLECHFDKNQDH